MDIEIVDLPNLKMVIFNSYVAVYQRVIWSLSGPLMSPRNRRFVLVLVSGDSEGLKNGIPQCTRKEQPWQSQASITTLIGITMWGPLVISWFITPSNYGYNYQKP